VEVMVLGAGRGTRLAPLGLAVPKILVDVAGEPLLARQLRYLAGEGAGLVVVNAHHLAEQVATFAAEHSGSPELVVVTEPRLLGTAGGVRNALRCFGADPIVVLYGDVLTDASLAALLDTHARRGAPATITVYESTETEGKGTVIVDDDGWLVRFAEKEPPLSTAPGAPGGAAAAGAGPALINAGLYVVDPDFVSELVAEHTVSDFGHDVFPDALARGIRVAVHRLPEPVLDVGTPRTLRKAQPRDGRSRSDTETS
jgi:mannose-1-phosphate guanylyltransferase